MATNIAQQIIAAITGFLTTGDGTVGPISATENLDIAGQKIAVTETVTVEIKKA